MKSILLVGRLVVVIWFFISAAHSQVGHLQTIEGREGRVENICKGFFPHLPRSDSWDTEAENQQRLLGVPTEIMEVNQDVTVQMEMLCCIHCCFRLF